MKKLFVHAIAIALCCTALSAYAAVPAIQGIANAANNQPLIASEPGCLFTVQIWQR